MEASHSTTRSKTAAQKGAGYVKMHKNSRINVSTTDTLEMTEDSRRITSVSSTIATTVTSSDRKQNHHTMQEFWQVLETSKEDIYPILRKQFQKQFAPQTTPPCYACILAPLAIAIPVAIAVGVAVPLSNTSEDPDFDPNNIDISTPRRAIATNVASALAAVKTYPNDGCGKGGVLFDDGNCYPLLRPCRNPLHWTTVNPVNGKGKCSPRLCGRKRVFVGRTQLCHDIDDSSECTGGRRLYYTAYGDPICDCPIGQYPFPTEKDNCVPLFTRGPCPSGKVFSVLESGFGCAPAECRQTSDPGNRLQQLVPGGDGFCYALGSRGPCSSRPPELLSYDVLERKAKCVNINNVTSVYYESSQLNNLIDQTYKQRSAEFGDFDITLVSQNFHGRNENVTNTRRQGLNTRGILQFPTESPSTLLNPCRPGPEEGNNYKCSNPLLPVLRKREMLQAVRSAFTCPGETVLQAKGTCGTELDSSNCGPTYQFNSTAGQCQKFT